MTNTEFSNEFDVLYNSITSNQAPGLDEYEKSVFLTKAQSEILREYFNPRVDGANGGFDGSQKRQYDFSSLIKISALQEVYGNSIANGIDKRGRYYQFPADYFLSVNEIIEDEHKQYSVISISYSDYQRLMMKPYAYPPKNSVWRLFTSTKTTKDTEGSSYTVPVAEIIGKFGDTTQYRLRYIKRPSPILLSDFSSDGVTIEGQDGKGITEDVEVCELPKQLHQEILERAVTLAKIVYLGGTTSTLAQQQNKNNQQ